MFGLGKRVEVFNLKTNQESDHSPFYSDQGYDYYKVPVADGLRLSGGQVSKTCAEAGLMAVCNGDASCQFTDTTKCLVTPHESGHCLNPM